MYFDKYLNFSFSETRKLGPTYDSKNLFLNYYDYNVYYERLNNKH